MNSFDFLINHLPTAYRGEENTRKQMKIWGVFFDTIISYVDALPTYFYIDTATEEWLELLGLNIGRPRKALEDLEVFRSIVKINYYNTFVVPTHNNILRITNNVTGFYPYLKQLWELDGTNFIADNTDFAYYLAYDLTPTYPTAILDELEKFYMAGVKLIRDYLYKLEQNELKVATMMNNDDVLHVDTVYGFDSNFEKIINHNNTLQGSKQDNENNIIIGFKEEVI